jgi:hypothetical protein
MQRVDASGCGSKHEDSVKFYLIVYLDEGKPAPYIYSSVATAFVILPSITNCRVIGGGKYRNLLGRNDEAVLYL